MSSYNACQDTTALIGFGAVIGSWLPYVLTNWFGVDNSADNGKIPHHLIVSFIIGAFVLVASILVTLFSTKEYSPEELAGFEDEQAHLKAIEKEGIEEKTSLMDIFEDFRKMPTTMRQLSWVQFFSWFALFGMWVFTTPAIAQHIYGLSVEDHTSPAFQEAGDWVGHRGGERRSKPICIQCLR